MVDKEEEKDLRLQNAYLAGKLSRPPLWRTVVTTPLTVALWWGLPCLVLWGAGLSLEAAARVALCPLTGVFILGFGVWAVSAFVSELLGVDDEQS